MSFELLMDRYQIDSVLSQREGKRSLKAVDRANGHFVFIREYAQAQNSDRRERLARQADLLKRMSHPRIPALLDYVETEDRLLLISQFVPGQTLAARLAAGWKPQEKDALGLAEQLLQILSYLQSYELSQLSFDLSPDKLLVDALDRAQGAVAVKSYDF